MANKSNYFPRRSSHFKNNKVILSGRGSLEAEIQDKDHTKLPRCMHMHDDRVEILYVRKGSGKYIINNKTYTIIAGDILIFEANVLHDESADKDCDVEIISCSVGGVQLQGFAPHKILQNSEPVLKTALYGEEVEHLLNRIYLKILYDAYHMYLDEGKICETTEKFLPYIGHIHIADAPGRNEPGTGAINYKNFLKHLDKIGYKHFVGFELYPSVDTKTAVKAIRECSDEIAK